MRLAGVLVTPAPVDTITGGDAAPFRRRVERQDSHSTNHTRAGWLIRGASLPGYNRQSARNLAMSAVSTRSDPSPVSSPVIVTIASLDQEGRGIARVDGKAVFVEGAL